MTRERSNTDPPGGRSSGVDPTHFRWGPLDVAERIGRGSSGDVYRAFDPVLKRAVALKLFASARNGTPDGDVSLEEARLLAQVQHPNVPRVHGIEEHDGRLGIWMELIDGPTLEQRLLAEGPSNTADLVAVGSDLGLALAAVHAAGSVHGRLRTTKAMRRSDGRTVLLGFGRRGGGDASGDLSDFGGLLYRLATGRDVEPSSKDFGIQNRVAAQPDLQVLFDLPELRPDLPHSLVAVIQALLDPCVERRPPSAAAVPIWLHACTADDSRVRLRSLPPEGFPSMPLDLIGRDQEIAMVIRGVLSTPVTTLTGSGGIGKTRLARECGTELAPAFPGGVFWIDLADATSAETASTSIARATGTPALPGASAVEAIAAHLRAAPHLLILDNCEQLPAAWKEVLRTLLESCPNLRLLATSRKRLGLEAELVIRVQALAFPANKHLSVPEILSTAAARLFVDRARAQRANFSPGEDEVRAIGQICRQVEGIPLAIELAAARTRAFGVNEIAARLEASSEVLRKRGTESSRVSALNNSIAWSVDLLTQPERVLFRRLGTLASPWTLDIAEQLCGASNGSVVAGIQSLTDSSLLDVGSHEETTTYRYLEPIRQFALERLTESGELQSMRIRHFEWAASLAIDYGDKVAGAKAHIGLPKLRLAGHNLRLALETAARGDLAPERGYRLVSDLRRFLFAEGLLAEYRSVCLRLAERSAPPSGDRALFLISLGLMDENEGDLFQSVRHLDEACDVARRIGDRALVAQALIARASSHLGNRDFQRVRNTIAELEEVVDEVSAPQQRATALSIRGRLAMAEGDPHAAVVAFSAYRDLLAGGAPSVRRRTGLLLVPALRDTDRISDAHRVLAEVEDESVGPLSRTEAYHAHVLRASLLGTAGQIADAKVCLREALPYLETNRGWEALGVALHEGALLTSLDERHDLAARMIGLIEAVGIPIQPQDQTRHEQLVQSVQRYLGAETMARARAESRRASFEDGLALLREATLDRA